MKHISLEIILKMKLFGGNFCFKEIILTQNSKIEKLVLPAARDLKRAEPTKNYCVLEFR